MRSADSLATTLLVSRLCAEGVQPLKAAEFWRLFGAADAGQGEFWQATNTACRPGDLPGRSAQQVVGEFGFDPVIAERVARLTDRATAMAFELERLEHSGIRAVTVFDDHYPASWRDRLGSKAPPLIHAAGALELLSVSGLGVVGSRDVSAAGGDISREIGSLAARLGVPLVSGGARGVDQLAMSAAFGTGGRVVGVVAEALARKLKQPDVRRAVHDGTIVLCSPYSPNAPFSAGNAMGRNKLIYAQAALTVVVASADGSGGTWSGASESLRCGYGPVAVWRGDGEGPGNSTLEKLGATPVCSLDRIETLLAGTDAAAVTEPDGAHQRGLF